MVVAISPPGWNGGIISGGRVHGDSSGNGQFRGVIAVALAGAPCPKHLHFAALLVATAVLFAAAGLTIAGLLGLLAAAIPPFGLHFALIGGAMVFDVMYGLWLCVLCQIFQIHCDVEE
jgi:hypothetical protein